MNTSLRALSLVVIAGVLVGCTSAAGSQLSPGVLARGQAAEPNEPEGGPRIDWDHPFMTEGRQHVDPAALAADPASFGMPIRPVKPELSGGKLRWVDISAGGPGGTVAYMFDFTGEPAFPTDGRVAVEEWKSDFTQDELINTHWAASQPSFTSVGAITIVVPQSRGPSAEAWFVYGGTFYDIEGPALGPAPARDIATQLAQQVAGS